MDTTEVLDQLQAIKGAVQELTAGVAKLDERVGDLDERFTTRFTKFQTAHWYQTQTLSALRTDISNLADRESRLDEKFTQLETEKWFAKTLGQTGYRPELKRSEPAGESLLEYRDSFNRPSSPYRR